MNTIFLQRLLRLLILLILQVAVLNHIHLLGYVTPLVIGYMLVCLHRQTSRVTALLWGFSIGFLFDILSNTAGMAASACTLTAMLQPVLLEMHAPRNSAEDFTPSFATLGFWNYTLYVFILMSVLHAVFYLLDAFTLHDWPLTLFSFVCGSILSTALILLIEVMVRKGKEQPQNT